MRTTFMIDTAELKKVLARRWFDILLFAFLSVIGAVALALAARYILATDGTKARPLGQPIPVQALPASVQTLHEIVGASGTTAEITVANLTNRVVAKVVEVPVEVGMVVKQGQLLARLDDTLFESQLEYARTNHAHTSLQLQRMLAMQQKGFASAVEVEQARTADAAAQDQVVQAQFNLTNTQITSPAPAIVLLRNINPGEITTVGNQALLVGIIEPIYMVAQVAEEKISSVRIGMEAEVSTDGFPGVVFTGKVAKIDGSINDATRTFGVYISIPNHDLRLIPGITGYARLQNRRSALAVPSTAVIDPVGDRATVFVLEDGRAHARAIRRGLMADGQTEILDGLQEGEQVVTVGQLDLRDNDRVNLNHSGPWNK
ncbi:MAG: efflux RND transporter periplasmic adaptor subunit [Verrucomicrobia bacterium]|nr:efflux RND transporter periplasmic adaptor subunit [Verrucomicrobiota bacterium]